ncbi:MAG: acetyl-coenzyme A synthetase N-terminal domain-containing protein, partial [Pseudomonadota bacterium]
MTEHASFPVPEALAASAHCNNDTYLSMYQQSVDDPDGFWAEQAKRLDWQTFPTKIKNVDYADNARIRWYEDGILNVAYNCVDRHLATRADQTAIIWEGDDPTQ